VYCFEQVDQPTEVDLEDLAVTSGALSERADTIPSIGPTVVIEADAVHLPPAASSGLPYYSVRPDTGTPERAVAAVAIPYFQWDNRDGRAMRIWMPRSTLTEP
jgi:DUF1680 family protein